MSETEFNPRAGKPGRRPKPRPARSSATSIEELVTEILVLIDAGELLDEDLSMARKRDLARLLFSSNTLTARECAILRQLLLRLCDKKAIRLPTYWFSSIFQHIGSLFYDIFFSDKWYELDIERPAKSIEDIKEVTTDLADDMAVLEWVLNLAEEFLELKMPQDKWAARRRELVFNLMQTVQGVVDLPKIVADAEIRIESGRSDAYAAERFMDAYNELR